MNVKLEYIDAIDGGVVMKIVNDADAPALSTNLADRGYHVLNVEQLEESTFHSINS
ncbi:MAG: hypothetical protein V2A65_08055 [Candidatus Omnitrophota bacterium]